MSLFLFLGVIAPLIFVLLFGVRFWYGYEHLIQKVYMDNLPGAGFSSNFGGEQNQKRNYASKEHTVNSNLQPNRPNPTAIKVDQKYEKIADISTKTTDFETEETKVQQQIEQYESLVQFEQKRGNKGHRLLLLHIGVPPLNFDALYEQLSNIGTVQSKHITKTDKTNEYKALNATKISLEKTRASLIELKTKGGQIKEFMELETQILGIEQQLQALGVSLGDFDEANEFCTIQFSLAETKKIHISLATRVKDAIEWAVRVYLQMAAIFLFLSLGAYLVAYAIEFFYK
jgi:hypothetical protein